MLLETNNPLPTDRNLDLDKTLFANFVNTDIHKNLFIDPREIVKLGHRIDKSSDRREHLAATEILMRLTIPIVLDSWTASTPESTVDSDIDNVVRAKLKGLRIGSKFQLELSIFSQQKQLKFIF